MPNPKNPNNLTRFAVSNAEEYCAALQNNELIKKYVEAVAAANKAGAFDAMTGTYLDSTDGLLTSWVEKQLMSVTPDDKLSVYKWANACAYKLRDTNYIYMYDVGRGGLYERMKQYENQQKNAPAKRQIDAQGNIIVIEAGKEPLPFLIATPPHDSMARTPQWAGLYALALPNGVEVMEKISSNRPQEIADATAEHNQKRREYAEERQQAENKKMAAEKLRKEEEAKKEALADTPDAKLTRGYEMFQVIEKCAEVRKGYAVVYLSDAQYLDVKNKIKQIENKLKSSIKASTDQLWAKAVKINNDSPQYNYMANVSYQTGSLWCNSNRFSLDSLATEVLGQQAPIKNF